MHVFSSLSSRFLCIENEASDVSLQSRDPRLLFTRSPADKSDTVLNVESNGASTSETAGLVNGKQSFRFMGLEPSPELVAISMGEPHPRKSIGDRKLPLNFKFSSMQHPEHDSDYVCPARSVFCSGHPGIVPPGCIIPVQGRVPFRASFGKPTTLNCSILAQYCMQHASLLIHDKTVLSCDCGLACLQVAFLTSFAAFPWVVKPLYGFLSDTVPIFGYKRRSYLIICGLLGGLLSFTSVRSGV